MHEKSIWQNPATGFRMMVWDPVAIAICIGATIWGWQYLGEWALIAPYVLGNFFLFCNVFRVRSSLELVWAATILLNGFLWLYIAPNLWGILVTQSLVTLAVLVRTVRSHDYRGIRLDWNFGRKGAS